MSFQATRSKADITLTLPMTHWNRYLNKLVATEISRSTRYYDKLIQWHSRKDDKGFLLSQIECPEKEFLNNTQEFPDLSNEVDVRAAVLINGTLNHDYDIEKTLADLKPRLSRSSRVIAVTYNPYLAFFYWLANFLGIRKGELPSTFITRNDLSNIAALAGYDVCRIRPVAYSPWKLLGLGNLINKVAPVIPVFRWLAWCNVIVLRPRISSLEKRPTLSVLIPARNERGNIENALKRMPDLGTELEIIFIEGHSSDGTWEEIRRVSKEYSSKYKIQCHRQSGKGKGDAVRLGMSRATSDLVVILDADLTMPPELLGRFYEAYCKGLADFINGTRLVYPMEGEAMRFLNRLGNVFFAKSLSFVLDARLGDSLCGTKMFSRRDWDRFVAWRNDFGDFDPFGDFEMLFPAAILGLGVIDVPIRYLARTYGTTNISRFRHGLMLLKMTLIGLFRIKCAESPKSN